MSKIMYNGTAYTGRTADSIARRVWGRTASVLLSPDPNSRVGEDGRQAQIIRTDKYGTHVLAQVVVYSTHPEEK